MGEQQANLSQQKMEKGSHPRSAASQRENSTHLPLGSLGRNPFPLRRALNEIGPREDLGDPFLREAEPMMSRERSVNAPQTTLWNAPPLLLLPQYPIVCWWCGLDPARNERIPPVGGGLLFLSVGAGTWKNEVAGSAGQPLQSRLSTSKGREVV